MMRDPQLDGPDATTTATTDVADTWRRSGRQPMKKSAPKPKPTHYKVICISMYTRDLQDLDAKVTELKRRGKTKMNKSELIRLALSKLDIEQVR